MKHVIRIDNKNTIEFGYSHDPNTNDIKSYQPDEGQSGMIILISFLLRFSYKNVQGIIYQGNLLNQINVSFL